MHKDLAFHIEQNDYFGTLATVLGLIGEDLAREGRTDHAETLAGLRDELIDLQGSCRIELLSERTEENSAAVA